MKLVTKWVVLFLVAAFLPQLANADTWVKYNSTNTSLPTNSYVLDMVKDSRDAKWLYGVANNNYFLYLFDGSNWTDHSSRIYDLFGGGWCLVSMTADTAGNVWFNSCNYDLASYNGSSWSETLIDGLYDDIFPGQTTSGMNGYFQYVFADSSGNLYATVRLSGTVDGNWTEVTKVIKRSSSGSWTVAADNTPNLFGGSSFYRGAVNDTNGDIWLMASNSSGAGIYRYHNSNWTRYTTSDGLISNNPADVYADSTGKVWVASDRGVSEFDGGSWSNWTTSNSGLATNVVSRVGGDTDGKIWFLSTQNVDTETNGGTSNYDPSTGQWSYYSVRNGDSDLSSAIYVFFLGNEMWANTGSGGVLALIKDNTNSTLYGQVNGATVVKASFETLKKSKKKNRRVAIYRLTRVKKKNKTKTRKTRVYSTRTSNWYKALNLSTGQYFVKVQGKKSRTVNVTGGESFRVNF